MPLPRLEDGAQTRNALHQAIQILRAARKLGVPEQPNWLHLATLPERRGASTGPLSIGGEMRLDYARAAITWQTKGVEQFAVGVDGSTQRALFETVFDRLRALGHEGLDPDRAKVTRDEALTVSRRDAEAFAEAQWRMFEALALFKARLRGLQTPVVLWPHGFDLSTIWFARGNDESSDPHFSVGFSPGTPDVGEPYIYVYGWPSPDGMAGHLPADVEWTTSWSTPGGVLRWSHVRAASNPVTYVADVLLDIHRTAAPLLGGAP